MANPHRIILLAHGSSDQRWCDTFEQLAKPTLETIVARGKESGATSFTIVPLFMAAGRHLRKDVPAMIEELEKQHGVEIRLADPIGQNPHLGEAIRDVVQDELGRAAV